MKTIVEGGVKVGFKARRKNVDVGKTSKAMILPSLLEIGLESSMAGNRLILSDPRGEIPEDQLLKFYENVIEPQFWEWYKMFRQQRELHLSPKLPSDVTREQHGNSLGGSKDK